MTAAKKQTETAAILRAGRSKAASHNAAAKATMGKGGKVATPKRVRVMLNVPPEMIEPIKAAAADRMISMSMYFVHAAKEKLDSEGK
jgi:hypothetical protein